MSPSSVKKVATASEGLREEPNETFPTDKDIARLSKTIEESKSILDSACQERPYNGELSFKSIVEHTVKEHFARAARIERANRQVEEKMQEILPDLEKMMQIMGEDIKRVEKDIQEIRKGIKEKEKGIKEVKKGIQEVKQMARERGKDLGNYT